jgi:signal peptidase I
MESTLTKIPVTGPLRFFEDILNDGLTLRVRVTGRSMTPFLKGGEVLTIKKVHYASLKKGDLIFLRKLNGVPVLHRLIAKKKGQNNTFIFQTKGDSIMSYDEPVHEISVLGKVCTIEKVVSYGKTKTVDMETFLWKTLNFFIATGSVVKSKTYFAARRVYRIKQQLFTKH